MRRAGPGRRPDPRAAARRGPPRDHDRRARRDRRGPHPRPRRRRRRSSATTASRPPSARRSTTRSCTASPATGCCATATSISIDCGAIVDGWHGDAAITVAGRRRSRRDVAELMRVTEEALWRGHRRRPARRPGHRHLARGRGLRPRRRATTASSRTTSATASARRCTSRRTCPTTAARARARSWSRGWRWPSSRWSPSAASETDVLDDDWTVVTADGSWAAHFEHTFTLTPTGPGCSPRSTAARQALAELGVPVRRPLSRLAPPGPWDDWPTKRGVFPSRWCRQYGARLARPGATARSSRAEETSGV